MKDYICNLHKKLKTSAGFSLVELVVATGMMSILVIGSMSAINSVVKVNIESQKLHHFQDSHYINLVKVQNVTFARRVLNPTPRLLSCFSGKSSGCDNLAGNTLVNVASVPGVLSQCPTEANDCFYSSNLSYKINCTATQCTSVDFKLTTTDNTPNRTHKEKVTTVSMPGLLFAPKQGLDYSCTAGGNLAWTLNYDTNFAGCQAPAFDASCATFEPLQGIGSGGCEPLEHIPCLPTGIHKIGLFQGQSACTVVEIPPPGPRIPPQPPEPIIPAVVTRNPVTRQRTGFLQVGGGADECWVYPNFPDCGGRWKVSNNGDINECMRNTSIHANLVAPDRPTRVNAPDRNAIRNAPLVPNPCGGGQGRVIDYGIDVSPYIEVQNCLNANGNCDPAVSPVCGNLYSPCNQGSSCLAGGKLYSCLPD
ncbi:MAG: hypothetical protein KC800_33260 [Candidatus Eremiobacteraeota bacterium]|nr:hypothetical protein [Candidatus Eremiobacteraeota bacterium]